MIFSKKKQFEFQKNGFLIFRKIYSTKELSKLKKVSDKIIKLSIKKKVVSRNLDVRINLFNKNFSENIISNFINLAIKKKIVRFSEQLINSKLKIRYPYVIFTETSNQYWHQDSGFEGAIDRTKFPKNFSLKKWKSELPFSQIQFNIPLYDDSYLWVVPGSQTRKLKKTEKNILNHSLKIKKLVLKRMENRININLKAGDCLMYHPLIIHARHSIEKTKRQTLHWYWVARKKYNPFYQNTPSLHKNTFNNLSNYLREMFYY